MGGTMRVAPDKASADLLTLAARGDGAAQLALVDHAYGRFESGEVSFAHAVHVAEVWARLAVVHGTSEAWERFARVLLDMADLAIVSGDGENVMLYVSEVVSILDHLADGGDDSAVGTLLRLREVIGEDNMRDAVATARALLSDEGGG